MLVILLVLDYTKETVPPVTHLGFKRSAGNGGWDWANAQIQ
jgi:hypothetical protein